MSDRGERYLDTYDEDHASSEALLTLEERQERAALERAGFECAAVEIDAGQQGPLYQYAVDRRQGAIEALVALGTVDPKDAVAITTLQANVHEYLRVARWARGIIERGKQAEQQINEVYRGNQPDD